MGTFVWFSFLWSSKFQYLLGTRIRLKRTHAECEWVCIATCTSNVRFANTLPLKTKPNISANGATSVGLRKTSQTVNITR